MILTALDIGDLSQVALVFDGHLAAEAPWARAAFARIMASADLAAGGVDTPAHRAQAVALAQAFGMATLDEEPAVAFSWDGRVLRCRSESYVIVHEVAHYLVAPPQRRFLLDFGLGAGPETGRVEEAEAVACVDFATRETEETLASLLGILWEVEMGQPGIAAFLEQNWLEGYARASAARHFARFLTLLVDGGFCDPSGRPTPPAALLPLIAA
ncbi:hypothetical protein D3874_19820 [Oleomonas cavernae]|uniref:Elongation factor P hydroxylase n=1 Tax=Oleomonas cavernae TaxID=2320859 RepID=A0A418WFZ0_9PROT|nr:hypothetical protein [Oleomonas cavernae]RJF88945.1 hypothetical protein D3874_19820 [Oleomonas cavernae]